MDSTNTVPNKVLVNSKLPASSFRIGQISGGPPRGAWTTTNWLPIIVKSSVSLGALPEAKGFVSWIPPHAISNAILDVAFAEEEPPIAVNLVHPRSIAWRTLIQPVGDALVERKVTSYSVPLVVPGVARKARIECQELERRDHEAHHTCISIAGQNVFPSNLQLQPGIKLLNFMRSMARSDIAIRASGEMGSEAGGVTSFATAVAEHVSPTMKELKSLSSADATQWVDYWVAMGMFQ
ncbi:hypothetical protein EV702DRAFT_1248408 [Suillus placidus]|uniref:Uncharacterized protein n=1 Tax=Suillus placidus TaxID=48579 RepID=A0A9P6ZFX8_9AGAM|nr:hypothetical protein EV702DRAFT_1222866 [Suillus placidus]KAG1771129.1 hypothetical protein EV702DRAFT_1248408 [Suillus placidus]